MTNQTSDLILSLRIAAKANDNKMLYEAVERIEYLTEECDRLHDVEYAASVPVVQLIPCPEFERVLRPQTCGLLRGIMVGVALSIAFVWAPLTFWLWTR